MTDDRYEQLRADVEGLADEWWPADVPGMGTSDCADELRAILTKTATCQGDQPLCEVHRSPWVERGMCHAALASVPAPTAKVAPSSAKSWSNTPAPTDEEGRSNRATPELEVPADAPTTDAPTGGVVDLLAALQESVRKAKASRPAPTDEAGACGAEHPTNTSAVPCVRDLGHDGSHMSTTGCAGSIMHWPAEASR